MISFFLFSDVLTSWGLADSGPRVSQFLEVVKDWTVGAAFIGKSTSPKPRATPPLLSGCHRVLRWATTPCLNRPRARSLLTPSGLAFSVNHIEALAHASPSLCLPPDLPWCFPVWPSTACHSFCCRELWVRTSFTTIISVTAFDTKSDYNQVQVRFKTLGLLHVQDLAGKEHNRPTCIQRFPLHREQK